MGGEGGLVGAAMVEGPRRVHGDAARPFQRRRADRRAGAGWPGTLPIGTPNCSRRAGVLDGERQRPLHHADHVGRGEAARQGPPPGLRPVAERAAVRSPTSTGRARLAPAHLTGEVDPRRRWTEGDGGESPPVAPHERGLGARRVPRQHPGAPSAAERDAVGIQAHGQAPPPGHDGVDQRPARPRRARGGGRGARRSRGRGPGRGPDRAPWRTMADVDDGAGPAERLGDPEPERRRPTARPLPQRPSSKSSSARCTAGVELLAPGRGRSRGGAAPPR